MTTRLPSPRHPLARPLAWLRLSLTLLALGGATKLQWMGYGLLFDPASPEPARVYGYLLVPLNALAFALLGALVNLFRPENRFGWLASLHGLILVCFFRERQRRVRL